MPLSDNEIAEQFAQDKRSKLILERNLRTKLRALDSTIVNKFRKDVLQGQVTNAFFFQKEYESLLTNHYESVSNEFSDRTLERLSDDGIVSLTDIQQNILDESIRLFIKKSSRQQARVILETTQSNMSIASQLAAIDSDDIVEQSVNASANLSRKLRSRETGITSFETQSMAQTRKLAEADIIAGKDPLTLQTPTNKVIKEWVTSGDEVVRAAHVSADAQLQPIKDFFVVMGQNLRFPGDTAFGATIKNTANCRCESVFSRD